MTSQKTIKLNVLLVHDQEGFIQTTTKELGEVSLEVNQDTTLDKLKELTRPYFFTSTNDKQFDIQYKNDKNEWITIHSNEEWQKLAASNVSLNLKAHLISERLGLLSGIYDTVSSAVGAVNSENVRWFIDEYWYNRVDPNLAFEMSLSKGVKMEENK